MTDPAPARPAGIAAAIECVVQAVTEAGRAAEAGAVVDLAGLDRRAAGLCAEITQLEPASARSLLPDLERLIAALDALADALGRQVGPSDHASRRSRAVGAYGRTAVATPAKSDS